MDTILRYLLGAIIFQLMLPYVDIIILQFSYFHPCRTWHIMPHQNMECKVCHSEGVRVKQVSEAKYNPKLEH